jgi:hypothetical protein
VDLMLLPPVYTKLTRALRKWSRLGNKLPRRRDRQGTESAPKVRIRWRSRSQPPKRVRAQMADAR